MKEPVELLGQEDGYNFTSSFLFRIGMSQNYSCLLQQNVIIDLELPNSRVDTFTSYRVEALLGKGES